MPRALIEIFGGKAIGDGPLAPRSRRGVVGAVDGVRRGATIPLPPTGLTLSSATTTSATLTFTAPSSDGGSEITNYQYSLNGGSSWTDLSPADVTSPVTVSGLSSNTVYTINLRSVNAVGPSETYATVSSVTTLAGAPTGLSAVTTSSSAIISFTAPSGSATITNYNYSLNGGASWTALSPADSTSPVTVSGLASGTAYTIYLQAVNAAGAGTASAGVAATTSLPSPTSIDFLVIAGGGPGGNGAAGAIEASGGGAGGYRTSVGTSGGGASAESAITVSAGTSYTVTVGAGGAGTTGTPSNGSNSVFATITSNGGGYGGGNIPKNPNSGGSGGGGCRNGFGGTGNGAAGTSGQGYAGGSAASGQTAGGGGAGAVGGNAPSNQVAGGGGAGVSSSITGTAVTRGGGGGGASGYGNWGAGGAGGGGSAPQNPGAANTGGGGGGAQSTGSPAGGNGGSGFVVLRYPDSRALLTSVGAGLTYTVTTSGGYRIYQFTSGTGTITV